MNVKVYVEGGGDHNKDLQAQCRRGFTEFFKKAGLTGRMPRIVVCGGRHEAYESFRTAHEKAGTSNFSILLVDAEAPVTESHSWEHVRLRQSDGWRRPDGATPEQMCLMVQVMESWFYADKEKLAAYYGRGFRPAMLNQRTDIENIQKSEVFDGLKRATSACKKDEYSKGRDSFQILALIDPAKVSRLSQHAARLLGGLDRVCG